MIFHFANCGSCARSECFLGLHDHRLCHKRTRERERQANLDFNRHFLLIGSGALLLLFDGRSASQNLAPKTDTHGAFHATNVAYRQIAQGALSFVFSLDGECNGDGR